MLCMQLVGLSCPLLRRTIAADWVFRPLFPPQAKAPGVPPAGPSMRLPILALAVSAFAIGTTEFVVMGLLPQMASDLGVSIPSAGMLVSGYALGVVLGGPLLAMA